MAAPKKDIDRVKLEIDYRAGVKSLRVLAKEYGISASRITQIADEEGWERDLTAKIKAKVSAKLNSSILNGKLNAAKKVTENEVVEANAEMQKGIILGHRTDISRHRSLSVTLLEELEVMTGDRELFTKLRELMDTPDSEGNSQVGDKLMDAFQKAVSHPGRVDSMKKLTDSLRVLIDLERKAFGIDGDDKGKGDGVVEDAIKRVLAANG